MTRYSWLVVVVVALAVLTGTPAFAQTAVPPPDPQMTLGSTIGAETFGDLPTSQNIFSLLETTQTEVISDRFYTGGLNTGEPARTGAFLNSWTQTLFRIGDVNITDPNGSGAPLLFPELSFWQRVDVATGLMPADSSAPGLAVTLEPRRPAATWTRIVDASGSRSALVGQDAPGQPPAIARLNGWTHGSALFSGPVIPERLGLVAAGSWTETSQFARSSSTELEGSVGSAFAHLVFTPTAQDEMRTLAWIQRSRYPFTQRVAYAQRSARQDERSVHLQSTWERRSTAALAWRLFGGYTERSQTSDVALPTGPVVERLRDGPVPELVDTGGGTARRWSLGARVTARPRAIVGRRHALQMGVEVGGSRARVAPGFRGAIGERVDDIPARMWNYSNPGIDAHRHDTTIAAFAADRIGLTPRVVLDLALRYDGVTGAADGALNEVAWRTWLPRATIRWDVTDAARLALFTGYGRTADQLPLALLAFGDPAAPVANVYRWNGSANQQLIARVGPGTGGDATFSGIDPALKRPYTDEFVIGVESRPKPAVRLRLAGIAKWEKQLIDVVDVGVPASSYTTVGVADPGLDLVHPDDDQILPVFNRLSASFGRDRYLVANTSDAAATLFGLELTAQASSDRLFLLLGGTASQTGGSAANRGFQANENDPGVVGELFTDPNAATFARGRLFADRAFTAKLTVVYRFPKEVRLGAIARYQDGQPFARLVVVPGLAQGAEAIRAFPNGGSRFTYTGTLDVRLQKGFTIGRRRFDVILDGYNVINLRNEVEERVVTGANFRTVTAVQPPRAVHVGVRFSF